MMAGAAGLFLYSILVSQLLARLRLLALPATISAMPLWFLTVFALQWLFLTWALTMTIKIDPARRDRHLAGGLIWHWFIRLRRRRLL